MSQPPGRGRARPPGPPSPLNNYRPPSPWAPSPPPLISGPRHSTAIVTPPPVYPSPKPFRPLHSPHNLRQHSPSPSSHFSISPYPMSPTLGQSPEYYYSSPYEPVREYDYAGVPLEPPPPPRPMIYEEDEEDRGPSTAEIIAQQSQEGYVDEKLAEYQATIQLLQGTQTL